MDAERSARMHGRINTFHGFVYFAAEAAEEYAALGIEGRTGYFASRAAPLGPVPAEVIIATFYNFHPGLVRHVMEGAWDTASPAEMQAARFRGVGRVLERVRPEEVTDADLTEAVEAVEPAIDSLSMGGRPLGAANAAVALPDEPLLRLWQLATVLREWRGDAHIAVLVAEGLDPCECLVVHGSWDGIPATSVLAGAGFADVLRATRRWPGEEWAAAEARLVDRGLMATEGGLTDAGNQLRSHIEARTDLLAAAPFEAMGEPGCEALEGVLRPFTRALRKSGVFPF